MEINCTLVLQWYSFVRGELISLGLDVTNISDQECAIKWISWNRRRIKPSVRNIHKSAGFQCPVSRQQGLNELEEAFKDGKEIWPWQSTLIDRIPYEDKMYNDFGIMHFHLGVGPYTRHPNYIDRTDELLFVVINSKDVYEVGVYLHNEWYELDILDIINNNWPNLLDKVTINAVDIKNSITDRAEVRMMREANVNIFLKLQNGRIIAPLGGGAMIDGTSTKAVQNADFIIKRLRQLDSEIPFIISEEVKKGKRENKNYTISLQITDDEISYTYNEGEKSLIFKMN